MALMVRIEAAGLLLSVRLGKHSLAGPACCRPDVSVLLLELSASSAGQVWIGARFSRRRDVQNVRAVSRR